MRFCAASNGDAAAFGADLRAIIGPMRALFAESGIKLGFVLGAACFGYNSPPQAMSFPTLNPSLMSPPVPWYVENSSLSGILKWLKRKRSLVSPTLRASPSFCLRRFSAIPGHQPRQFPIWEAHRWKRIMHVARFGRF